MSWQVRLGNLDEEIQEFLEKNPEFPANDEREFAIYAIREEMKRWIRQKEDIEDLEEIVDEKVKERLS